jgi:hypothetical protein
MKAMGSTSTRWRLLAAPCTGKPSTSTQRPKAAAAYLRPLPIGPFTKRAFFGWVANWRPIEIFLWHYARRGRATLNADEPEALIYEPLSGNAWRLVGVEFITLASAWESHNPGAGAPSLEGHLLNYVGEPNRYGLPAFYEIHVWGWERNPNGSFADWNTRVSCDRQPLN